MQAGLCCDVCWHQCRQADVAMSKQAGLCCDVCWQQYRQVCGMMSASTQAWCVPAFHRWHFCLWRKYVYVIYFSPFSFGLLLCWQYRSILPAVPLLPSFLSGSCVLFAVQCKLMFPEEGLVYDYVLDDAGISRQDQDEMEDEETVQKEVSSLHIQLWICSFKNVILTFFFLFSFFFLSGFMLYDKKLTNKQKQNKNCIAWETAAHLVHRAWDDMGCYHLLR